MLGEDDESAAHESSLKGAQRPLKGGRVAASAGAELQALRVQFTTSPADAETGGV